MAAKRTCGRYVTPFNCISGDFVLVVPVVSFRLFRLFWWFRFGCSGGFGGFVLAVPVVSVVPVVPVVSFRPFRFGVSGFSTCLIKQTGSIKLHIQCTYFVRKVVKVCPYCFFGTKFGSFISSHNVMKSCTNHKVLLL